MKYKTIEDVMKAENLFEAFEQYLKDKGMTIYEYAETEEGQRMQKQAEQRFSMPTHEVVNKNSNQK